MAIFELIFVLAALGLFASGKSYQSVMTGGLLFIGIAVLVRWGYSGRPFRPTKLDKPLILLVVAGGISLWASYDFSTSLAKFGLILASIVLFYILGRAPLQIRLSIAGGVVLFATILAIYFATQENALVESGTGSKFPLLVTIGATLRSFSPQFNLYQFHPNIVAGVLEVGLLLGVGLWLIAYHSTFTYDGDMAWRAMLPILTIALGVIALALFLTGSRGAWLAVGLAGLGWFLSEMRGASRLRVFDTIAIVAIMGSLLLLLLLEVRGPTELATSGEGSSISRAELYRGSSLLVRDYLFTGAGFGTFPMLYSAYVLGTEVIIQNHPHNLYLSIWLEQGILGLIALLWLGIGFIRAFRHWRQKQKTSGNPASGSARYLLATTSFWVMIVIFAHGLIDSVHYNSRFLPLIFMVMGLSGFLTQSRRLPSRSHSRTKLTVSREVVIAGVLVFVLLLAGRSFIMASWYANLGAVEQAKIELTDYEWPDRIPSKVRATADLSQPISLFERALAFIPNNRTAKERLAILSRTDN